MQSCDICGITSTEVRIFDAVHDLRMSTLCERCAIIENIPIIKKPNSEQLKESEIVRVSDRMKDISGMREEVKEETFFKEDKLKELDSNPELELPEKENLNLIDNFHWEIMKQRRRRGLSQNKLADSLGESEIAIQMIEKEKLPENAKRILKKLEQVFQINLRNKQKVIEQNLEPILVDEEGETIDYVPEDEEMIFVETDPEPEINHDSVEEISLKHAENTLGIKIPEERKRTPYLPENKDLNLDKINKQEVTIGDLQKLHEKKSITIREENLVEQNKIEERQRFLKESRERDRQRIELEKQQDKLEKENDEIRRNQIMEQKRQEVHDLRQKESSEVNSFLGGSELLDPYEKPKEDSIEEFDREL